VSQIRQAKPHAIVDELDKNLAVMPKTYIVRHNVNPAPQSYSLAALEQEKKLLKTFVKDVTFPRSELKKCDFFFDGKDLSSHSHSQLALYDFSCMRETPTFSFGKTQSRDAASYLKQVIAVLNNAKKEKELVRE